MQATTVKADLKEEATQANGLVKCKCFYKCKGKAVI
jgi:hypothetical protein